jgi:hypothetical protein
VDVYSDVVDDVVVLSNENDFNTSHLTQKYYEVEQLSYRFNIYIGEEGVVQGQNQNKYNLMPRTGTPKDTTSNQNRKKKGSSQDKSKQGCIG